MEWSNKVRGWEGEGQRVWEWRKEEERQQREIIRAALINSNHTV